MAALARRWPAQYRQKLFGSLGGHAVIASASRDLGGGGGRNTRFDLRRTVDRSRTLRRRVTRLWVWKGRWDRNPSAHGSGNGDRAAGHQSHWGNRRADLFRLRRGGDLFPV